jgi:hypothetical protein
LSCNGVECHLLSGVGEEKRVDVKTVDGGPAVLCRLRVTTGERGPGDARAALMLPLKQHDPVEVGVDEVQNCVLIVELLRLE